MASGRSPNQSQTLLSGALAKHSRGATLTTRADCCGSYAQTSYLSGLQHQLSPASDKRSFTLRVQARKLIKIRRRSR
jgi:hypothetical protein